MRTAVFLVAMLICFTPAQVLAQDADNDGLTDNWELAYFADLTQGADSDPDGDGLSNLDEQLNNTSPTLPDTDGDGLSDLEEVQSPLGLNPTNPDTDGDFLDDGDELVLGTDPTLADTDGDGLKDYLETLKNTDPKLVDTDGGGTWDGTEVLVDNTSPLDPADDQADDDGDGLTNYYEGLLGTLPDDIDTDDDGLTDGEEDKNHNGSWDIFPIDVNGETNALEPDTDGDGLNDGGEAANGTDPFSEDSDGDGLTDGDEVHLLLTNPTKADSDQDGLDDGEEVDFNTDPWLPDTDSDGLLDVSEAYDNTDPNNSLSFAIDQDGDGISNKYENTITKTSPTEADTDGDGLEDAEEVFLLSDGYETDPLDADSDEDGLLDGTEVNTLDTNPNDWDSDNDKLSDGLEYGLVQPEVSLKDPGATHPSKFDADEDPSTTTNPKSSDTDGEGLSDSLEDKNLDGAVDVNETDPDNWDTDGDDMDDYWEWTYSTQSACSEAPLGPLDPLDAGDKNTDNDQDGLSNFEEYDSSKTNPCLVDTDDDGLFDSTEVFADYDPDDPQFGPSNPNLADTDGDGLPDGDEDANADGIWDSPAETSPLFADSDSDGLSDGKEINVVGTDPNVPDSDGDGLTDGQEYNQIGTNPLDWDSDDDNLSDGLETGLDTQDTCPDSKTNPLKPDTDGDGLDDGLEDADLDGCFESGDGETDPADPDTDNDKLSDGLELGVSGDSDPTTTTDPLEIDSDSDGLWDSHEDKNKDGSLDSNETDPNLADSDNGGVEDGTEVFQDGTNPLDPLDDYTADPDGDGLLNGQEIAINTNPYEADSDGDTISDTDEVGADPSQPPDTDQDNTIDALDGDSDGDTIPDKVEAGDTDLETPPVNSDNDALPDYQDTDADNDTLSDEVEWNIDAGYDQIPDPDADGDGIPNYLDPDSDNAQGSDQEEGLGDLDKDKIANFVDPIDDDPDELDFDNDGLKNQIEDLFGTDIYNKDTDNDGLTDNDEYVAGSDPLDIDSDDDGVDDGLDTLLDSDADGLAGAIDPDRDNDGLFDGTETGVTTPLESFTYVNVAGGIFDISGTDTTAPCFVPDLDPDTVTSPTSRDSDGDSLWDGWEDPNHNGRLDDNELPPDDAANGGAATDIIADIVADHDGDSLTNRQELWLGVFTNDGDLDDDGIPDGREHNWRCDTDGDGLPNYLDPDADNDGLADGTEEDWLRLPEPWTWTAGKFRNFTPDADPETVTFMLLADSDGDGSRDGLEDHNHDGSQQDDESDPMDADHTPTAEDSDSDGLNDPEEAGLGSNPADADSDDDGVLDGHEPNSGFDLDGDGLRGFEDPDADNDGIADGTEMGLTAPQIEGSAGTDLDAGHFVADEDPDSTTLPSVADTDGNGVSDGGEDTNKNGAVDAQESNPLDPTDDGAVCADTDGDGLCNAEEELFGTNPFDVDSDDDGLFDGDEHNWNRDHDGDGLASVFDPDSDGDGLPDGLEQGVSLPTGPGDSEWQGETVTILGTNLEAAIFHPDSDPTTTTFMLVADSDHGGISDSAEDYDTNGAVDAYEIDPLTPEDDEGFSDDLDEDGLDNLTELELGTDPKNPDSDGDFIPDGFEVGENPDEPLDTDRDGNIDALDTDSDGDTIPDSIEAGDEDLGTDPTDSDQDQTPDYIDPDSDNDGLTDLDEATFYNSDPTLQDTDGGGADDFVEVMDHGTDPTNGADDFTGWFEEGAALQGGLACGATERGDIPAVFLLLLLTGLLWGAGRFRWFPTIILIGCLIPATAFADYQPDPTYHPDARNTAVEGNYYRLAPDLDGILSVHSDAVPLHTEVRASLMLHYAYKSLAVVRNGKVLRTLINHRFEGHIVALIGLLDLFSVGLQAPVVLYQDAQFPGRKLGSTHAAGIGNLALFAKMQILDGTRHPVGLAVFLPVFTPTGDTSAYMGYDGWGLAPSIALTAHIDPIMLALNVGYHLQPKLTINNIVDDDKITAGFGASWAVNEVWEADLEMNLFTRSFAPFASADEVQAEIDAGVKARFGSMRAICGIGTGLTPGYMTPPFRIFAGLEYAFRPDPDRDADGLTNLVDRCPDEKEDADGFEDEDGCPEWDNDRDGIPDDKDRCRDKPEDLDGWQDEDGCPDSDNDADGIPDGKDACPNTPEDLDKFEDDDGCPDNDNDGDGIPDKLDKCRNEKETYNDYLDDDGCPDKKLAEFSKEARRITILEKVHFKFMSADIQEASFEMLDQVVEILKENPQVRFVQVEGHTDKTGKYDFNMKLSMARAKSVMQYLVKKGIAKERLRAQGFGWSRRIDFRVGPEANFNNRRVEFNILKFEE
jgi:large repetitive protein